MTQTVFKNHAVSIKVIKYGQGYIFFEAHLPRGTRHTSRVYPTREAAIQAMQRYSYEHYGEKAV